MFLTLVVLDTTLFISIISACHSLFLLFRDSRLVDTKLIHLRTRFFEQVFRGSRLVDIQLVHLRTRFFGQVFRDSRLVGTKLILIRAKFFGQVFLIVVVA